MGFSYKPIEITLVLIAITTVLAIYFRLRKGAQMSWPLMIWVFLFWFQFNWEVFDPLYLAIAAGTTLLVRYEFHGGAATKFFIGLEAIALGWAGYTAIAEAFAF